MLTTITLISHPLRNTKVVSAIPYIIEGDVDPQEALVLARTSDWYEGLLAAGWSVEDQEDFGEL